MDKVIARKKRPINQIKIAGTQILNIDLNQGWEITNIEFDGCCPSNYIDKLVVTFEKIKGENKNMTEDMTKPDYEQICKEYKTEIDELNKQNNDMQIKIQEMKYHIKKLEGRVAGLEFAIRCNGVSGGEVTE